MSEITTKTKESHTVDGTLTYEAVECYHCDFDTPIDSCVHVYIPDRVQKKHSFGDNYLRVKYTSDGQQRVFCEDCAEQLFGDVDSNNYLRDLDEFIQDRDWKLFLAMCVHVVLVTMSFIGFIALATLL